MNDTTDDRVQKIAGLIFFSGIAGFLLVVCGILSWLLGVSVLLMVLKVFGIVIGFILAVVFAGCTIFKALEPFIL